MLVLLVLQLLVIPTLTWCGHDSNLHESELSLLAIQNNEVNGDVEITI